MNSWIFQANPQEFMIDYFLANYASCDLDKPDWRIIEPKYKDIIIPGDVVYIWKAKSEPPKKQFREYFDWIGSIGRTEKVSGIFAIGEVISHPKQWKGVPIEEDDCIKKYRVDKTGHQWDRFTEKNYWVFCKYNKIIVRKPLLQEVIWDKVIQSNHTDLAHFKNMRQRSSIKLESWESKVIESLLVKG